MFIHRLTDRLTLCCAVVLFASFLSVAVAQEKSYRAPKASDGSLEWRFEKGQAFSLATDQNMTMTMNTVGREVSTVNHSINEMNIKVLEVGEDGTAKTSVTIDRMQLQVDAGGQKLEFDSREINKPLGPFQSVADLIKPMIGKSMTQDWSKNGKISNFQIPEEMLTGANQAAASTMNKKSLQEMSSRSSLSFPEANPALGFTWQVSVETQVGPANVVSITDYTYLGVQESEAGPEHVIRGHLQTTFPKGSAGPEVTIKNEDAVIFHYFDGVGGRLLRSELTQDMTMQFGNAGREVQQHLVQTVVTTFSEREPTAQ